MGGPADANTATFPYPEKHRLALGPKLPGYCQTSQPQWTWCAKIDAVQASVDLERTRQAPRSTRKLLNFMGLPVQLHLLEPLDRFQRPNQDAPAHAFSFRGDVQHKVIAIAEIHVSVSSV